MITRCRHFYWFTYWLTCFVSNISIHFDKFVRSRGSTSMTATSNFAPTVEDMLDGQIDICTANRRISGDLDAICQGTQ